MNVRLYSTDYEGDIADQAADRVIADVRLVVVRGSAIEIMVESVSTAEDFDSDEFTVCVIP